MPEREEDEVALEPFERKYEGPGLAIRGMRTFLWVAAVLGALYVASVFWDGIEAAGYHGDNEARWLPFAGLFAFTAAVFALLWSYRSDQEREALKPIAFIALLFLVLTGFAIYQSRDNNDQLVSDYCSYGATSVSEWIGCVQNVDPGQVIYSKTPAADFANGREDDCGVGAGPFCSDAVQGREAREVLSELEEEGRWP